MSRKLEEFVPLESPNVGIYTCGPTVYAFAHIGNYRAYVWEDLLCRYLRFKGFDVTQVMNLTDVDDKTIRGANEQVRARHSDNHTQSDDALSGNASPLLDKYTARYKDAFFADIAALNIVRAAVYPEATKHIAEMVELVQTLMDKGFGYRSDDGSIYYSIAKFKEYGKLSGMRPDRLLAGARIRHDEYDKDEWADFALWKAWDESDGDVFWETALGKGRPGWHVECSAMSMKYLGKTFDIHTGGEDNIFPHHENEIAQSEAATGAPFVKYWLHCAHLIVEGRKMSKSLGNYFTLRDILDKDYGPMAVRYLLMSTHYRQQLNFTFDGLDASQSAIDRLLEFKTMLEDSVDKKLPGTDRKVTDSINDGLGGFKESLDDDLNISAALGAVFEMVRAINKIAAGDCITRADAETALETLAKIDSVIGVLETEQKELTDEMRGLIADRESARKSKDFAKADEIREKLLQMGVELKDTPDGTKWKIK